MDRKYEPAGFLRLGYCGRGCFHPHLHCVIPGGGLSPDHHQWIRPQYAFFLPIKVLGKIFRGKFVDGLRLAFRGRRLTFAGQIQHLAESKNFSSLSSNIIPSGLGGLCQAGLRRARTSRALPRTLYSSCCDFQSSIAFL